MADDKHNFGGAWTYRKLEIIDKYLKFYSSALYKQPFNIHYVDPFSGTGTIGFDDGLFNSEPIEGSVARSLKVKRPFHCYHFNEPNRARHNELKEYVSSFATHNVSVTSLDANDMIVKVCDNLGYDRAVFFIDPYGCQLDWKSLVKIAQGAGNDVWLWFPVSAVIRQASIKQDSIQPAWRSRLNKLFGDAKWESALYTASERDGIGQIDDLFGDAPGSTAISRQAGTEALDEYVMGKLNSIFPYVNDQPISFKNQRGSTLFNLYFAMSNNSDKAIALANRGVKSILK